MNWWKKNMNTTTKQTSNRSSYDTTTTIHDDTGERRTLLEQPLSTDDNAPSSSTGRISTIETYQHSSSINNNTNSNDRISRQQQQRSRHRTIFFRILIVLFLLLLVSSIGLYIQKEIYDLNVTVQSNQQIINHLKEILIQHEYVIERFNSSVSSNDVLQKLTTLQDVINTTKTTLEQSLITTQHNIDIQLNNTTIQLQATVDIAERMIQEQVVQVKKDVEQYIIQTDAQFSLENSFMIYQLAGTFTVLSCLISMWHMTQHVRKLNQPNVQRKILAILWMSPIYAVTSWFSLVFPSAEIYLAIVKDGYEGYIIYTFLSFCIAVIGRDTSTSTGGSSSDNNTNDDNLNRAAVVNTLADHAHHLHPPYRFLGCLEICGCIKPIVYENNRELANAILVQCQYFAMQFVFLRPLTTIATAVFKNYDLYHGPSEEFLQEHHLPPLTFVDGTINLYSPQLYIIIIQNVSIFFAFTGLLKFYHAVDKELNWCKPFAKFLCIKGVVFMTFWQGLAISVLAKTTDVVHNGNAMHPTDGTGDSSQPTVEYKAEEWAKGAQNFLICLEMLLFSIAHFYCFPVEEWQEGYRVKHSRGTNLSDTVALGDFVSDLKLLLLSSSTITTSPKKKPHHSKKAVATIPEGDNEEQDDEDANTDSMSIVSGSSYDEEENSTTTASSPLLASATTTTKSETSSSSSPSKIQPLVRRGSRQHTTRYSNPKTITEEEQAMIAKALEQSLGSISDDPEIVEAKKRLLASKILSPEYFDFNDDDDNEYMNLCNNNPNKNEKMNSMIAPKSTSAAIVEDTYCTPKNGTHQQLLSPSPPGVAPPSDLRSLQPSTTASAATTTNQ